MTAVLQLTYTSFDNLSAGRGGWQVKDRSPGLSEQDVQTALTFVATELDLAQTPSPYPSTDEIARLPRRLAVHVDERGTAFVVHTSYAGADASGRHGNVFNHVLVVPAIEEALREGEPRPLERWRSPGWLVPYGADAVRDSAPPAAPPAPGAVVTRETVGRFLSAGRGPAVAALLDAVDEAAAGGPLVVLALDDQDEAALWLGAVSFLAPARMNAELSFSTYERAHSLQAAGSSALLSVVPGEDAAGVSLLATHRLVDVRAATPAAPTRRWALLGRAVADAPPAVAAERLLAVDELTALNPGAAGADPLWPLALAVAESDDTSSGWGPALHVLLQVPLADVQDDETRVLVRSLTATAAGSTPDAARALLEGELGDGGVLNDHLGTIYETYVAMALRDDELLLSADEPWTLSLDPAADAVLLQSLAQAVSQALAELPGRVPDPALRAILAVRAVDLADRLGVAPLLVDDPATRSTLLEVADRLLTGDGPAVLDAAAGVGPGTVAALTEALAQTLPPDGVPGERLPPEVAAWFEDAVVMAFPDALCDELLVQRASTHGRVEDRAKAARLIMRSPMWLPAAAPAVRAEQAAARVVGDDPWTGTELLGLLRAAAGDVTLDLAPMTRPLLLAGPVGERLLADIGQALLDDDDHARPLDAQLSALARVHILCGEDWWREGVEGLQRSVELLASGMCLYLDTQVTADLSDQLRPHLVAAAVRTIVWSSFHPVKLDPGLDRRLGEILPDVPDLNALLAGSMDPLVPMLVKHDDLASGLLRLALHAHFPDRPPLPVLQSLVPPDLLHHLLQPADTQALGHDTLAEAAVSRFLARRRGASSWVDDQLLGYRVPARTAQDVREWAGTLLPAARSTARPLRPPAYQYDDLRSAGWQP